MKLAWGNSVSKEFRDKVIAIAQGFGWPEEGASWLMACIAFESGGSFSPSIKNAAGSGATGLIQFMPPTANGLGTTTAKLAAMSAVEQLDYVRLYFKPYAAKIRSLADCYMAILLPKAVGQADDYPLFSGGIAYRQNSGLDADSDGVITKSEAASRVQVTLWKGMQDPHVLDVQPGADTMDPIAATVLETAIPKLFGALPDLVSIFKKPDVAARNVEALSKVGDIIMSSVPAASNMQDAVTKVIDNPQTASEVNNALRLSRADIMDIMERTAAIEDKRVADARVFNVGEPLLIETKWIKAKFVHVVSILLILFGGIAAGYVIGTSKDKSERAMALQTLLVVGFAGVATFWLGSSRSSQVKDEVRGVQ